MLSSRLSYDVVVVGAGHAGTEAAWAAANLLREPFDRTGGREGRVALVTMDPRRAGQMSCNPAIGGLAKGQMVREVDALGGIMGLAIDATGIQFRMLNASKGPAVQGPRAQADKYQYSREIQRLLATRPNLDIFAGIADRIIVDDQRVVGLVLAPGGMVDNQTTDPQQCPDLQYQRVEAPVTLDTSQVVLTTGTFMRGLMHTGQQQTPGGRIAEAEARTISDDLRQLGLELGRLKTGTPPRLDARTIDFTATEPQPGDDPPQPFSELTRSRLHATGDADASPPFPSLEQRLCHITHTDRASHDLIRENLDRAPLFNGQINDSVGPRYCPSIEDKVVRFPDRHSHHVFLEPESLLTDEVYCNGISTSLPADVQDRIVTGLPGCSDARILRYGYAVEYDMVWPHQIDSTTMTKRIDGLLLAGQINGTSGYEEAAAQGLLAGLNAVRHLRGEALVRFDRDQAYLGVLMDDLVTKVPREPYRMFTSRAEHRLLLRSDNAPDRLTPLGREWGLVDDERWAIHQRRRDAMASLEAALRRESYEGVKLWDWIKRPHVTAEQLLDRLNGQAGDADGFVIEAMMSEVRYAGFIEHHRRQHQRLAKLEHAALPRDLDYAQVHGLRNEAKAVLGKFRPATLGQAGRLAGITPADLTVLSLAMRGAGSLEG